MPAGQPADDPLSDFINSDTYLIVTSCPEDDQDRSYVVCEYSPRTGLAYIGTGGGIES
ncbi:MAG: hypothetical protein SOY98_04950 [Candidatus Cryptobacteroides sp.]|nr:hypothetical protein [Candidatus Cryptobacteroides sp.]